VALGETFAGHGYVVLRCDLPFRQVRRTGPPFPGNAERDRAGLRHAVAVLRKSVAGRIFLGGHSYGGRQATMFCAAEPELVKPELVKAAPDKSELVAGLLLLSYPLHPPRKPEQLRIQHLPSLRTPSLFVQGTRDPFGSVEEITNALQLIPAKTELMKVEGAGHDLGFKGKAKAVELPASILAKFQRMFT
jgi:predicted alpha/beta-hydrolase family hydrolase